MNKKQRENRKESVKRFMAKKREYNKNNPDTYEIKKLKHKGEHAVRLTIIEKRELRKWRKKKTKQLRKTLKEGLINEAEYNQKIKELKNK